MENPMEPIVNGAMFEKLLSFGAEGLFYLITLIFLFFSLSFTHHWLAYGTNRARSILVLAAYLGVSALFFIGMIASLSTL